MNTANRTAIQLEVTCRRRALTGRILPGLVTIHSEALDATALRVFAPVIIPGANYTPVRFVGGAQ